MAEKKSAAGKKAALIAAAMLLAVPFIGVKEGLSLKAYQDVAGVWTICHGETLGVKPGDVKTRAECEALTRSRVGQFMGRVYDLLQVDVSAPLLAAHTSFAYNIGIGGYAGSTTLRKTNAGDLEGGCEAMMNWSGLTKGGIKYDCRRPENLENINGCRGLMARREEEKDRCLSGVE